jgi:hypothetical protein
VRLRRTPAAFATSSTTEVAVSPKYCPNCGEPVDGQSLECDSCGQRWDERGRFTLGEPTWSVDSQVSGGPVSTQRVVDLSPRELRREIRWGVFQGLLLYVAIGLVVYLIVVLIVLGAAR